MVHQNPQPLLVPAAGDFEALALHPYGDRQHQLHHQQQQQIFEPVIYVNKPFWQSASRLKKAKAKAKAESRKNKKSRVERYDLSTTTVALYLLRYNVALQIAATAIVINLLLSVATFACGLNSLYCAFGMDCVIGTITSCILVWRFASAKTEHIKAQTEEQAHLYLLSDSNNSSGSSSSSSSSGSTFSSSTPNCKSTSPSAAAAAASLQDLIEASCRSGLSLSLSLGLTNAADTSNLSVDSINTKEDQNRELWSTFWLGQVMILSGIGVVVRTLIEVISHVSVAVVVTAENEEHFFDKVLPSSQATTPTSMEPLYLLALISLALNLLLMAAKLVVYVFLRSNSMLIEGVNSFISALFASVAAVSIRYSASVAYLDQIVSLLFGIFLITYGGYNMLVTVGETVYQVVMNGGKSNGTSKKQYFSTSSGRGHHHHQQQYQMLV